MNAIKSLFKPLIEDADPNNPLASSEIQAQKIYSQVDNFMHRIKSGYEVLLKEVELLHTENSDFIDDATLEGLKNIGKSEEIPAEEFEKHDLKTILKINGTHLDKLYNAADTLFIDERFKDAADGLFFLANLDPTHSIYWHALGLCEYFQERWQEALNGFMMAALSSNPPDLKNVVYMAHCYNHLGDKTRAREIIDSLLLQFEQKDLEDLGDLKAFRKELDL